MEVIHGEGKPRIVASDVQEHSDIVADATSTTVTLTTGGSDSVIVGRLVNSVNGDGDITTAKALSYDGGSKVVTIDEWIGGIPAVTKAVSFLGKVVDLPYCQALIESFGVDQYSKKLYATGRIEKTRRGFYYFATLDYNRYFSKEDMEQIEILLNTSQGDMLFYPRRDNASVNYLVSFPDDFVLQWQQRQFHSGHRLVVIQLEGVERKTDIDLSSLPSDVVRGYGEDYADGMYVR
jgi:hypothetical protein